MEGLENRKEQRFPVEEPATLRVVGVKGAIYVVTILDVSASGMRLSCPLGAAAESKVEIHCREAVIEGYIRYARDVSVGLFHIGVEATRASRQARAEDGSVDLTVLFAIRR